ncbi:AAA family ATPase [Psychrobacter sp. 16-MNA-CIBAN-0192]|uniref:AAA family ATPase n=2 Tax=unclassified Psychrobacter TaxID=196806 RepID=UPI00333279BE
MRLKSLKLAGFKSFANATTFTFPRGITAIVGPNGCGKSNVIDAIRWVLGETSAKQLRGGAMSDVIFAGTQDKAAKSVASVELTFEHTQDKQTGIRHALNLYQELSVRRQVNLEGRSDYFINGTRCRRRDVVDIFLGTGLGARSYAVIEQGMIGRIIDSNPLQLREFIEEAAGVSRYQARREETQKKLEKTRDNLARLHDMQSEMERQQKTLSKQAASAQRYHELSESLADIQQKLAIQQLYQAKHTQQQQKLAHEQSASDVAVLQADYQQLKAKQDKLTVHINQEQWLKDDAQSAHYEQQLHYQQAEYQLNDVKTQLATLEHQYSQAKQQRNQAETEIATLKGAQIEQQLLENSRPQLAALTAKRANYQKNEQSEQRAWNEAQHQLIQLQEKSRALEQQQALSRQAQQRLTIQKEKWTRRHDNWQALWAQLQASVSGTDTAINKSNINNEPVVQQPSNNKITVLTQQLQQIIRQQDGVSERIEDLQPQALDLKKSLAHQQRELAEHEKRQALLSGEYETLHQILHPKTNKKLENTNTESTVSNILASNEQPLPVTTLREHIELSKRGQTYAAILDKVLALWLDSHVLIARGDAQNTDNTCEPVSGYIAELLTYQQQAGQAKNDINHSLWLPAAIDSAQKNTFTTALPNELADDLAEQIVPLSALIAKPALALWQQCYLYLPKDCSNTNNGDDRVKALSTILKTLPPSALLLTMDGWIISSSGTINITKLAGIKDHQGSSQFLSQRLTQRTRLEELEALLDEGDAELERQQQTMKHTQRDYDALMVNLEELRAQITELTRDSYQLQQQLSREQAMQERLQADSERLYADKSVLEQEEQELKQESEVLKSEQLQIDADKEKLSPQLTQAQQHCQQLQQARNERNRVRQADDNAWQSLQLNIQQSEIQLAHSHSSLVRVTELYEASGQKMQMLETRMSEHQQRLPKLQADLQAAQVQRDQQQLMVSERETVLTQSKQEHNEQQTTLEAWQTQLQAQQSQLADHATALALSAARLEDMIQHAETAVAHYHKIVAQYHKTQAPAINIINLLADFISHARRVRPDKMAELSAQQSTLEQQLSKIGAVNLAAVAELDELNERLEPLAQQTADIAASMDTLKAAITSIDETTKTLFMQTLDAVNIDLGELFAKVFGGGQASLTLNTEAMPSNTPKSEQWRAGLTLMAQPKGKRNSRLAVLSGGEKTLTALSLIFAIFKQHPAPFCVLDEVDAPLDDANVARFTSLIHELADDLQFIFISHNKLAMQIADELKGITMPSAGISALVSVSLEDAVRYIES